MSALDYIKIRGLDGEPGPESPEFFEIFQGAGGVSDVSDGSGINVTVALPTSADTPISADEELADLLWEGQNEKLEHENKYCDDLQKIFKQKQDRITGIWDKLLDIMQELIGEWLGKLVSAWVFWNTGSIELTWLANLLTEVGTEWGLEALQNLLTRGNQLLDGIKAENNLLLDLEKSRENYEYREQVLARHRDDIRIVLEQIAQAEKSIEINTQLEMKALLERLTDLAFRDDTIETGDITLHTRGKVIEYGGN